MLRRGSSLWFTSVFVVVMSSGMSPGPAAANEFPTNDDLRARNVCLKVQGLHFASGLRPDPATGRPNGNGLEVMLAEWAGSGFIVGSDGTVLTNFHVAKRAIEAQAVFDDGASYPIRMIKAYDPIHDLAVFKITANKEFPAVKLGDSDKLDVQDPVMAVGNPLAIGLNVTKGEVSQVVRDDAGVRQVVRHTAPIAPGNSGGALYKGSEVIGVNSSGFVGTGFNMAVPINMAKPLLSTEYSAGVPLEQVWRLDASSLEGKAKPIWTETGKMPAASKTEAAVAALSLTLPPLIDCVLILQASEGSDLDLMLVDGQHNPIGLAATPGNVEALFVSVDNPTPASLLLINRDKHPAQFAVALAAILY